MKAFKNTRYENIFQSSLQTELSSKIRLSIIQYILMFDNAMCLNIHISKIQIVVYNQCCVLIG